VVQLAVKGFVEAELLHVIADAGHVGIVEGVHAVDEEDVHVVAGTFRGDVTGLGVRQRRRRNGMKVTKTPRKVHHTHRQQAGSPPPWPTSLLNHRVPSPWRGRAAAGRGGDPSAPLARVADLATFRIPAALFACGFFFDGARRVTGWESGASEESGGGE